MSNKEYTPIVKEPYDMIHDKKWEGDFAKGIEKAFCLAKKDLLEARIYVGATTAETVASFLDFCDRYMKWVPETTSRRDEALWMLSVFYFVFDQVPIFSDKYQTPIDPKETPQKSFFQ